MAAIEGAQNVRFAAQPMSAVGRVLPIDPIRRGRSRPALQLTLVALSIATMVAGCWRLAVGGAGHTFEP
jgi:hypothetical protein